MGNIWGDLGHASGFVYSQTNRSKVSLTSLADGTVLEKRNTVRYLGTSHAQRESNEPTFLSGLRSVSIRGSTGPAFRFKRLWSQSARILFQLRMHELPQSTAIRFSTSPCRKARDSSKLQKTDGGRDVDVPAVVCEHGVPPTAG